ncbi:phage virion morphogenesis protein [Aggregatibacter actinomycetemcomitans]|uniref:phage virion morphogenesis protein n=1 Tax=Aggregatibacter actinomycetemcomitans TaxID=714 RepID=UPI00197B92CF|nr:phage virion morphogenesis protein [Aggregatibacter actinomycetemcomitans]MBN6077379.1 phage virion morphogenesis protein [Aggregatibacter actinomycetemcomitans]
MIEVKINNEKAVLDTLNKIVQQTENRRRLMRAIAGTMLTAVDMNFRDGGHPAWLPVKSRPGGTPLKNKGNFRKSMRRYSDNDSAMAGTNVEYAAIHHFGGQTRPHVIKPVFKKALVFGGVVRKSVKHPGSRIPARPFLTLTAQDEQNILREVKGYFERLIK